MVRDLPDFLKGKLRSTKQSVKSPINGQRPNNPKTRKTQMFSLRHSVQFSTRSLAPHTPKQKFTKASNLANTFMSLKKSIHDQSMSRCQHNIKDMRA